MELTAKQIQKYAKWSMPKLRSRAGEVFRKYIRERDKGKPCISCGSYNTHDAGHYYSAGHYPELELNEDNVHLQCVKCNRFLHGNLVEYRKGLLKRIGFVKVEQLDYIVAFCKQHPYKHDRFNLIETIIRYK